MGGRRLRSFFTALQFLTRIHLVEQRDLTTADFGRSTRCFPLVGAVLGALYLLVAWLFGGQTATVSRVIYTLVGLASLWCISLLFRSDAITDDNV